MSKLQLDPRQLAQQQSDADERDGRPRRDGLGPAVGGSLPLDSVTYASFARWSANSADKVGMTDAFSRRPTTIYRAFNGEDPATFTPGHPDCRGPK